MREVTTQETRLTRWRTTAYAVWAVIGALILLSAAGYAVGSIAGALAPFVVAFVFVFILQSPVAALARRGMSRGIAVGFCFLVGFLAVSIAVVFIAPPVGRQLIAFANAIPDFLAQGQDLIAQAQQRFSDVVVPDWLRNAVISITQSLSQVFVSLGNIIAKGIVSAGSGIATTFFDLFLAAVVSYWTLKDLPAIRAELRVLAGEKYEDDLENLLATVGRVVGGYLKGQTIASLATGTLAGIGLAIIGVPYALVLGIITFVFNYVPYIGPFLAGLIAAAVGLFQSPLTALLAIVVVVAAQNLVDMFLTPRVMSEQVDLHPILVIFSLLVGGTLFGFWGMILAIPVAATAKGLFVYYYERKTKRQLATEDGALFRTATCDDDADEPCEPAVADTDEHSAKPENDPDAGENPVSGATQDR